MKKIFTFLAAALMSVSMFAKLVQEDITLDATAWWGWDSNQGENVDGKLVGVIEAGYGAIATSNVGNADWSQWEKLVVVLDSIVPSTEVQWWYLKAELRNPGYEYPASVTMTGELGKDGHDPAETNYVVIDLTNIPDGFDITQVDALVLQSEVPASFTVSRIFLEREEADPFTLSYEDKWLNIAPADTVAPYVIFVESKEYYEAGKEEPYSQAKLNEEMDLAITALKGQSMLEQFTFVGAAEINPKEMIEALNEAPVEGSEYVFLAGHIVDDARSSDVEYIIISYAGNPAEGIENIVLTEKAKKVVVNGMIYIVRDGKLFNVVGARVK